MYHRRGGNSRTGTTASSQKIRRPPNGAVPRPASMGKGGESSTDQLNGATSWTARTLKPVEKLEAREDFIWDTTDEPHASRRKEIMKAHPEVKKLFGHEWKSKYLCMFLLIIPQIWLSWYTTDFGWPAYLFVAYVFGATITQSLFLAIHELAHNLFFQGTQANRLFAMVANWPIGIAYCVPFRGYHLEHHKWQGVDGIDTDIPSRFEGKYVRGPVLKAVWCCCQILTYALRPMFIKAQDFTPNHLYNWISQIGFDLVVYYFWGYKVTLTSPHPLLHSRPSTSPPPPPPPLLYSRWPTSCSASSSRAGSTRALGTSSQSTTSSLISTPRRRPTRTMARSTGSRGAACCSCGPGQCHSLLPRPPGTQGLGRLSRSGLSRQRQRGVRSSVCARVAHCEPFNV